MRKYYTIRRHMDLYYAAVNFGDVDIYTGEDCDLTAYIKMQHASKGILYGTEMFFGTYNQCINWAGFKAFAYDKPLRVVLENTGTYGNDIRRVWKNHEIEEQYSWLLESEDY